MRVASVHIENFKRFSSFDLDFRNEITGDIASRFLLLGDNGSGKTTVLQAVALALSLVSGRTRTIEAFDWFGWVPGRYERWGRPLIELEVHFTEEELRQTRAIARRWYNSLPDDRRTRPFVEPGDSRVVTLRLEGSRHSTARPEERYQFWGRFYASQLLKHDLRARALFRDLPGVFWFDQFRSLASATSFVEPPSSTGRLTVQGRLSELRDVLLRWKLTHGPGKDPTMDWYGQIEGLFRAVFPGRAFGEPEPMPGDPAATELYFMLTDGDRTYDIEEASAGEQTVLPILFAFVVQQVAQSVVIIDEVDLNLHPPAAQAMIALLPRLGLNCQFLLSTHAEAVREVFPPSQIARLSGGKLCL